MKRTKQAVKNGRSLEATQADLCVGKNRICVLSYKEGNVIWIVEVAQERPVQKPKQPGKYPEKRPAVVV